jgi:hypothetical protein
MRRAVAAFMILTIFFESLSLAALPLDSGWQIFVEHAGSTVEWRIDPNHKLNFRHCERETGYYFSKCRVPMLTRGIDASELPTLLSFYLERLDTAGGHKAQQVIGIFTASIVGVGAYLSTAGLVVNLIPERFNNLLTQGGYHVVTIGGLLALTYYTLTIAASRHRQALIAKRIREAWEQGTADAPVIQLDAQSLFDEFLLSFRKTLWEFTHGGGEFNSSRDANIIIQ